MAYTSDAPRPQRRRVERGIYGQPKGKYAVCCRHAGRLRFRTVGGSLAGERRPRTLEAHRYYFDQHLLPAFGSKRVASISTDDVAECEPKAALLDRSVTGWQAGRR